MGQLTQTTAEVQKNLDWKIAKASGNGVKVDLTTPTFPWRDLLGEVVVRGIGGTSPSLNLYNGSTIRMLQFSVNDEVFNSFHIPHDYAKGTDIHIHAHWSHTSAAVTSGGVTWGFDVTAAKGHDQAPFPADVNATVTQAASTTQFQHMLAEVQLSASSPSAAQIDTDDLEPDGVILIRSFLSANTMNGAPAPFLHFVDIHYQSTSIGTKDKAPDFYA